MAKHLKLEDLTKSSVWTISESELNQMLSEAKKHESFAEDETHYMNIIRPVFDIQYFSSEDEKTKELLQSEHYDIFSIAAEGDIDSVAIRKRQIKKITDLTLENVGHLHPSEILALIADNMGTGWKGLPLAIQDIIESAFYVDSSVMPAEALHRKGGIVQKRQADGYEVLEVERGGWIEAIFMKAKPKVPRVRYSSEYVEKSSRSRLGGDGDEEELDEELPEDELNAVEETDETEEELAAEEADPNLEDIDVIDEGEDDYDEDAE